MAPPVLTNKFALFLGDGATPTEVFTWLCGLNTRGLNLTNNTDESVAMDCDTPLTTVPHMTRRTTSQDTSASGSGRVAISALPVLRQWADSGEAKNIRLMVDESAANNGGYWEFPAILQGLEIGQEDLNDATFTCTIVAAGKRTWVDAT